MTIVPTQSTQVVEASTVKLAEYAYAVRVCECFMWGVRNSPCADEQSCRDIWTKEERDFIAFYLAEAQEEIERELGYFVGRRWVTDERHRYADPIITRWGHVVAGGVKGETAISAGETVDHTTDPAIVGPVATTVTDESEIRIYHTDTDIEVDPSDITISGGFVTIEIPRCRLVLPELADNPANGLNYNTLTNFATDVDIVRVYNDTDTGATLVRLSCQSNCTDTQTDACIYVRKSNIGSVSAPVSSGLCGCAPDFVDLNYYSGVEMTKQMRDAIIRLAHTKMPRSPCACSPVEEFWKRDRNAPEVLSRERLNCPFGMSDGAWIAWRWTQAMKLYRGAVL